MWFITFSTKHLIFKTSFRLNRCLIKVKIKTLQVGLHQRILGPQATLVHCITFPSNKHQSILAVIAFISCWQLYRQSCSRTPFLTEFSVYNSKWRKKKRFNRAFDQYQHLIHSYLLLLKQQTWKCKRNCKPVLKYTWWVFLRHWVKITLEWITLPSHTIFISTPTPIMP